MLKPTGVGPPSADGAAPRFTNPTALSDRASQQMNAEVSSQLKESASPVAMIRASTETGPPTARSSTKPAPEMSQTDAPLVEAPKHIRRGWLWKLGLARTLFGRQTWKLRFIESDHISFRYYCNEPFTTAKGIIPWRNIIHVYSEAPGDRKLDPELIPGSQVAMSALAAKELQNRKKSGYSHANDAMLRPVPSYSNASTSIAQNRNDTIYYFGFRFRESRYGSERLFMLRTDDCVEHSSWVTYLRAMCKLYGNDDAEDEDGVASGRDSWFGIRGFLERATNKVRHIVSLRKKRFVQDGIDLDLAYILPSIIAMGFPSEDIEAMYRNPMTHVNRFFDRYHRNHFMVINLCSERSYPAYRFGGRFQRFPFDDHNPPPLELLLPLCSCIHNFLASNSSKPVPTGRTALLENVSARMKTEEPVVAVHCKAGKGRTGLAICSYLLYAGICRDVDVALAFFAQRRTVDGKGVQIPSQRRYLEYFESLIFQHNGAIPSNTVTLRDMALSITPRTDDGLSNVYARVECRAKNHRHVPLGCEEGAVDDPLESLFDSTPTSTTTFSVPLRQPQIPNYSITFCDLVLTDKMDVKISLTKPGVPKPIAWFWIHTGFLPPEGSLVLDKKDIDGAVKSSAFPANFQLTLNYSIDAPGPTVPPPSDPIPALEDR